MAESVEWYFLQSNRNGKLLVVNNFLHRKDCTKNKKSYFKCINKGCKARVVLNDDKTVKMKNKHEHPSHGLEIAEREYKNRILNAAASDHKTSLLEIFKKQRQEVSENGVLGVSADEVEDAMPSFGNIKSSAYRRRAKMKSMLQNQMNGNVPEEHWYKTNDNLQETIINHVVEVICEPQLQPWTSDANNTQAVFTPDTNGLANYPKNKKTKGGSASEQVPNNDDIHHKKRKFKHDYLRMGFFWTGDQETPKPHCLLCYQTLTNTSMKPSNLRHHFESKHKEYIGKPLEFFQEKCINLLHGNIPLQCTEQNSEELHSKLNSVPVATNNMEVFRATEASYRVSLLVAKTGYDCNAAEALIKPSAIIIADMVLDETAKAALSKVPISSDVIKSRITSMANVVESRMLDGLRQSRYYALLLDETPEVSGNTNLLVYVRYEYLGELQEEFMFCKPLPGNCTGKVIFDTLNGYVVKNNIGWTRCVGIGTDFAVANTVKIKEMYRFITPHLTVATCCMIHREQFVISVMPIRLKTVLNEAVQIVDRFKRPEHVLNARILKAFQNEMGSDYGNLLYDTETGWLSRGKVLTRLFELRKEIKKFLEEGELLKRLCCPGWITQLAYLADIFSTLNDASLALHGNAVTVFEVADKVRALRVNMGLWLDRIDHGQFDMFPTLSEFLLSTRQNVDREFVEDIKYHLRNLCEQLAICFPEQVKEFEWIRNPFVDFERIQDINLDAVELSLDESMKLVFEEKDLIDFWLHARSRFPALADKALKHLLPFAATDKFEIGYSTLVDMQTKGKKGVNLEHCMRLKLSSLETDDILRGLIVRDVNLPVV